LHPHFHIHPRPWLNHHSFPFHFKSFSFFFYDTQHHNPLLIESFLVLTSFPKAKATPLFLSFILRYLARLHRVPFLILAFFFFFFPPMLFFLCFFFFFFFFILAFSSQSPFFSFFSKFYFLFSLPFTFKYVSFFFFCFFFFFLSPPCCFVCRLHDHFFSVSTTFHPIDSLVHWYQKFTFLSPLSRGVIRSYLLILPFPLSPSQKLLCVVLLLLVLTCDHIGSLRFPKAFESLNRDKHPLRNPHVPWTFPSIT